MNYTNVFPRKVAFECTICMSDVPISDCLTLSCDHRFCRDCLVNDWLFKIQQGYITQTHIKCLHEGCNTPVTEHELKANITKEAYEQYLLKVKWA